MNGWDLLTWAAIVVLIFGAIAVFAWFLRDALRLFRGFGRGPRA